MDWRPLIGADNLTQGCDTVATLGPLATLDQPHHAQDDLLGRVAVEGGPDWEAQGETRPNYQNQDAERAALMMRGQHLALGAGNGARFTWDGFAQAGPRMGSPQAPPSRSSLAPLVVSRFQACPINASVPRDG